ncbi:MAG: glycosyltransferase [Rhodothermales bacterium]|nr:glycosyltransferase [Rhodothermales bacterium]
MPLDPSTRIVLLGPAFPYRGGIAHFAEKMYRDLTAAGHEVTVVTFRRQYPAFLFPGHSQFEAPGAPAPFEALRLIDTLNPLSWRNTARRIAAITPDLVVIAYWMPFFAVAFAAIARALRRRRIRTVAILHNMLPHERHPGDRWLSRLFLASCDGFLVMSAAVERDVRALGASAPIERIEHPTYDLFGAALPTAEARRHLGLSLDAPVLLFFGFIRKYKGLDVLLASMPAVLERLPDVCLVVAGESYEPMDEAFEFVRSHALERHVRLDMAYIPVDAVPAYFGAADVVVQPYRSATQSGVAQIAFHFEKPLIVTDVGGLAEVVPHERAGFVVPPNDPEALARAIVRFFEEDWADRLTAGVRMEKTKYSWDRLYEALARLLG